MKLVYKIEKDNIMVKDYLDLVGMSRHLKRRVRTLDNIYVNSVKQKNYYMLHAGDELTIEFKESLNQDIVINDTNLDILYEDNYFLIVKKENSISSQPSVKHQKDNLISIVKGYFIKNNIDSNIHLVNRLDYSTSGIVIIAKDGITHYEMSKIDILKEYLCIVEGKLSLKHDTIRLPISRHPKPDIRRYVDEKGKMAITEYTVLKEYDTYSLLRVRLFTGRTHQIRVHFSYLNNPLLGDNLYGSGNGELKLHCYHMKFVHPWTKEEVDIINYPVWYKEEI